MSYWYERISKKHMIAFLLSIPVLLCTVSVQMAGSYSLGCIATCSRTLYDWISSERAYNAFEVYPFVHYMLDTGCVEWLGFSTCEAVQFQDWMPIWMQNELVTIRIFNVTSTDQNDLSIFQTAELSPIVAERMNSDRGTSAQMGAINIKRRVTYSHNLESSRFNDVIRTGSSGYTFKGAGSPWTTTTLGQLLGFSSGAALYLDIHSKQNRDATMSSPSPVNKMLHTRSLYYYLSGSADYRRCSFDDDCGSQCTWTSRCDPLGSGNSGLLLPSATFLYNWKSMLELGHWPIPAWHYPNWCLKGSSDGACWREDPEIIIFDPEISSRAFFANTGDGTTEKFPDLDIQLWKHVRYARREEGCLTVSFGSQGKDCGVPAGYAFVADGLFVSSPLSSKDGASLRSEIHSEKTTGLRFHYLNVYQISRRMKLKENGDTFVPLFWVQEQPTVFKVNEVLQFSALKGYPGEMLTLMLINFFLYMCLFGLTCALFFYGMSCVDFIRAQDAAYKEKYPQYF